MKIVRESSPEEAVLVWLQAEVASERFRNDLQQSLDRNGLSLELITKPKLENKVENGLRLKVLRDYRDWFQEDINAYHWNLVELSAHDVEALHYIDYSYWNELSDGTHLVRVATENIRNGKVVYGVSNENFRSIALAMDAGDDFTPIVLLQKGAGSTEIVEGHARATGYVLARKPTRPLRGIMGS